MKNSFGLLIAMVSVLYMAGGAHAGPGNDRVKVEMLGDVSAIQPGKPFMLGFKFTIDPEWHIYWKNPGDSGLETRVKLALPDGFKSGELMFPVPERLQLPGDLINYAYENQVMLMMQVTPPQDLAVGKAVKIGAKASFLVCKEECVPGSEELSIELPVASEAAPANGEAFTEWSNRLPAQDDAADIASVQSNLKTTGKDAAATVTINWTKPASDVQYLPEPMKGGEVTDIKTATAGQTSTVTFTIKEFSGSSPVKGLVIFAAADGTRKGIVVTFPAVK